MQGFRRLLLSCLAISHGGCQVLSLPNASLKQEPAQLESPREDSLVRRAEEVQALASANGVNEAAAIELVRQLTSSNVASRRRAADRLAELGGQAPLPAPATELLSSIALTESDPLVWRSVMIALAKDESEAASRMVHAALSHPAAEVRRRACEHLENHAAPQHAALLLRTIGDQDTLVARSALRALALTRYSGDMTEIERLLLLPDKTTRLEAAICLAKLNAASGPAALERSALDEDPRIRRQAAAAMGRLKDPVYLPTLVRLLDDQGGVCQTALDGLASIAGQNVTRTAATSPASEFNGHTSRADEIRLWKSWFAAQLVVPPSGG